MRCEQCQEALSAQLDGEPSPTDPAAAALHLAGCPACREWLRDAERLHRLLRIGAATDVPDLTGAVLAAAPMPHGAARAVRIALAIVGLAQVGLGVAQLFGMNTGMLPNGSDMMSMHLFDEGTAWNLAAGIGLMLVAWRPAAAASLTAVLGAFVVILAGFCVRDLMDGMVTVSRVASHGLLLLGVILMLAVWRTAGPRLPRAVPSRVGEPGRAVGWGRRAASEAARPAVADAARAPMRRVGNRRPETPETPEPAVGRHRAA